MGPISYILTYRLDQFCYWYAHEVTKHFVSEASKLLTEISLDEVKLWQNYLELQNEVKFDACLNLRCELRFSCEKNVTKTYLPITGNPQSLLTIVNGKWSLRNLNLEDLVFWNTEPPTMQTNLVISVEHITMLLAWKIKSVQLLLKIMNMWKNGILISV